MDDYGLSAAQAAYDRQEGPCPFAKDDKPEYESECKSTDEPRRVDKGANMISN